jgi:hypothetical protein
MAKTEPGEMADTSKACRIPKTGAAALYRRVT